MLDRILKKIDETYHWKKLQNAIPQNESIENIYANRLDDLEETEPPPLPEKQTDSQTQQAASQAQSAAPQMLSASSHLQLRLQADPSSRQIASSTQQTASQTPPGVLQRRPPYAPSGLFQTANAPASSTRERMNARPQRVKLSDGHVRLNMLY